MHSPFLSHFCLSLALSFIFLTPLPPTYFPPSLSVSLSRALPRAPSLPSACFRVLLFIVPLTSHGQYRSAFMNSLSLSEQCLGGLHSTGHVYKSRVPQIGALHCRRQKLIPSRDASHGFWCAHQVASASWPRPQATPSCHVGPYSILRSA